MIPPTSRHMAHISNHDQESISVPRNTKPVFLLTHSRSCSTAIERIFWTEKSIKCFHEDFGGAFYFGPERVSNDWKYWRDDKITTSGQSHVTWRMVLERLLEAGRSQRYVFIKDMSYHIMPSKDSNVSDIPSLRGWEDSTTSYRENPTWLPTSALDSFQFAFLIRSPWLAIPSLYRLHVPPRVYETQLHSFKVTEIGYREIRLLIEYLYPEASAVVESADQTNEISGATREGIAEGPILIDASYVLGYPEQIMAEFCTRVGLPFDKSMLSWRDIDPEMETAMNKFRGYHDDAISSSELRHRTEDEEARAKAKGVGHVPQEQHQQDEKGMEMTEEEYVSEWTARYGEDAAEQILNAVYLCKDDYAWLRRFAIKPGTTRLSA